MTNSVGLQFINLVTLSEAKRLPETSRRFDTFPLANHPRGTHRSLAVSSGDDIFYAIRTPVHRRKSRLSNYWSLQGAVATTAKRTRGAQHRTVSNLMFRLRYIQPDCWPTPSGLGTRAVAKYALDDRKIESFSLHISFTRQTKKG